MMLFAQPAAAQDEAPSPIAQSPSSASATPPCRLEAIGPASVSRVVSGRAARLADGRELLLAGIEVPLTTDASKPFEAARLALAALVENRAVVLKRLGAETDRHGRLVAQVFLPAAEPGSTEPWVQQAMLAQGFARVAARVGDAACAARLLAAETAARAARLGLWADPYYVMRRAENPAEVLAQRGHFTLVEGQVVSVRESGGTIYVNFGRRWSEDFTVTVARRSERRFAAAGLELRKLAGHRVRIRGHVEERGGPWIEAMNPEQIELAERN